MEIATKFPVTLQDRLELGADLVRFPATWDEFWELLEVCEYPIEFSDNEIIAMSYESDFHASIASAIQILLGNIFMEDDDFVVFNPNRPGYVSATGEVFNPDASVVRLPGQKFTYRPGMDAEMTPVVLVEVLSKTTREHDLETKLPAYKTIESIEHIIFAESQLPYVTVYSKNKATGKWTNLVYDELEAGFEIAGKTLTLKGIYRKSQFIPRKLRKK
ncbi:MAG: Uma2 family endonuclease [Saprospiraceae bacterium]|nr:Uma2 family endonuclease [Saprospiraceae bacterium]